jgi:uncharacterized protein YgfB (UPF0149 family)
MSLLIIYYDLQRLLTVFPSDIKEDVVSILEEISSDTNDSRNILNLYVHDNKSDGVAEKMADDLTEKMNKLIKTFNINMMQVISDTEKEYRTKIKRS